MTDFDIQVYSKSNWIFFSVQHKSLRRLETFFVNREIEFLSMNFLSSKSWWKTCKNFNFEIDLAQHCQMEPLSKSHKSLNFTFRERSKFARTRKVFRCLTRDYKLPVFCDISLLKHLFKTPSCKDSGKSEILHQSSWVLLEMTTFNNCEEVTRPESPQKSRFNSLVRDVWWLSVHCVPELLCSTLYHRSILRILVHIRNIDLKGEERETRTGECSRK